MPISAISGTDTRYPVMINGYVCLSAADVRAARLFANPHEDKGPAGLFPPERKRPSWFSLPNGYDARGADRTPGPARGSRLDIWA